MFLSKVVFQFSLMKMKFHHIVFTCLCAIFLTACGSKDTVVPPETLLTEAQMIDILTDVQLIEGDLNFRHSEGEETQERNNLYYKQLFEHYGITDSIFNDNLRYYTEKPAILEKITDSVYNRLAKVQTAIQSVK